MLHFKNEFAQLDLDIACYEVSERFGITDSDGRNWLVIRATYREDDLLVKDANSCLLTYELKAMVAGLKVVCAGIRNVYESDFSQPYFILNALAKGEDTFTVEVSFTLPNTLEEVDTADLSVEMNLAEFQTLIDQLDAYCVKFPERE